MKSGEPMPKKHYSPPGARGHLSETRPELFAQARGVEGRPGYDIALLATSSNLPVIWECGVCEAVWIATPNARDAGRRPCPSCPRPPRRSPGVTPETGQSADHLHPSVAAEFVTNVDHPEWGPTALRPGSSQQCRWRCAVCCHEWTSTPYQRCVLGQGCPPCAYAARGRRLQTPRPGQLAAADVAPDLVVQFLANLTHPGVGLADLRPNSRDQCNWQYPCGHTGSAAVGERVRGRGCRRCLGSRIATIRRRPSGPTVADENPEIAVQFVENVTVPGRGPAELSPGSNDTCLWRCPRGHEWRATVQNRTKRRSGCPACSPAGKSRLEFEVAELVAAATGLSVDKHFRTFGRGRWWTVDLYLASLGLLADLDPAFSHRNAARDQRKCAALVDQDYVRLRDSSLPPLSAHTLLVTAETDAPADVWADVLVRYAGDRGVKVRTLDKQERKAALTRAAVEWENVKGLPSRPVLSLAPHLERQFVANLDRPGVLLASLSAGSRDRCEWLGKCGHVWTATVSSRACGGRNCSKCARAASALRFRGRAVPRAGESLADLFPMIAAGFIRCIDDEARMPSNLKPHSNLRCEWTCPTCTEPWITRVTDRVQGSGCPPCAARAKGRTRAIASPEESVLVLLPELASELIEDLDHPEMTAATLKAASNDRCLWRCRRCGNEWSAILANRTRQGSGCPSCRVS